MSCTEEEKHFLLGVDFGSTVLVAKICNLNADVVASVSTKVPYVYIDNGGLEIEQDALWDTFVNTVKEVISKAGISASNIKAFGFCSQRGTMMLWNKNTGTPYCNLISWQDTRCRHVSKRLNALWSKKAVNWIGAILYAFFRQTRFMLMKAINFTVTQSSMKLIWFLENNPDVKEAADAGDVLYGTLDVFIMWKLSKGKHHITDFSSAGGTALFDPYLRQWSEICPMFFGLRLDMFPKAVNTSGHILDVDEEIFGASFPLTACVGDTQATAYGQHCFKLGDACSVMGTGCFLTVNTGEYCHASVKGIYPQIAWKIKEDVTYICEGNITGIAASIEWAKQIGLFEDVAECSDIAKSVEDTAGMHFIPGFHGLTAPYEDPRACTGLIGVKKNGNKAHILRAICEGIAFRFLDMYYVMREETDVPFDPIIRVCGGISNNDFILELISSLTDCTIERAFHQDTSLIGAVYLAGLGAGIWKNEDDIVALKKEPSIIRPNPLVKQKYQPIYKEWKKAVERCLKWY